MNQEHDEILKTLSYKKVILPLIIGLSISAFLLYYKFDFDQLNNLLNANLSWIILAILVLLFRDLGYIYRIKMITRHELSWKSSFYVIILWEFTSAVTPSAVGGTPIAIFLLFKSGIPLPRAIAYVIVTALFDNLFFTLASGTVFLFNQNTIFPDISLLNVSVGQSLQVIFGTSWFLITLYNFIMFYGLFIRPRALKWLIIKIFSIKIFKKWRDDAGSFGDNLVIASRELKGTPLSYWLKIAFSTLVVWTSRFFIVNCLVAAFNPDIDHLFVFAQHCILWVIQLISITPGASGISEAVFRIFFKQHLQELATPVSLLWRTFTYWPYLILGLIILPLWLKNAIIKQKDK